MIVNGEAVRRYESCPMAPALRIIRRAGVSGRPLPSPYAAGEFEMAIRLDPTDMVTRRNLQTVRGLIAQRGGPTITR